MHKVQNKVGTYNSLMEAILFLEVCRNIIGLVAEISM